MQADRPGNGRLVGVVIEHDAPSAHSIRQSPRATVSSPRITSRPSKPRSWATRRSASPIGPASATLSRTARCGVWRSGASASSITDMIAWWGCKSMRPRARCRPMDSARRTASFSMRRRSPSSTASSDWAAAASVRPRRRADRPPLPRCPRAPRGGRAPAPRARPRPASPDGPRPRSSARTAFRAPAPGAVRRNRCRTGSGRVRPSSSFRYRAAGQ
ncbi:hypothetical protein A6302_02619 [Methylobrevis pamukkalensis]|uniref:Uncharacterized protein n=1 Tax=Methylobrevis pamukkalensis TaxID=1439726 RepID=A0A1E3H178_9HYPH|nr:hypothetical protein A6302_02619 [Methylobrevis pamukkalensis]